MNNNIGMSNHTSSGLFPQSFSKMVFPPSGQFGPLSSWRVEQQFAASYVEDKQDADEITRKKSRAASIGSSPQ